ncbi:unnamed protein product [Cylicocyclus nassatus]|uniref:Uncharacterized protein n=1 Tax=Cylicocyclus nassatus TaxID=53992 RepID=A0AA36GZT3_CYLNA|nr:unnamed protein product [Cylicocyclus nassatus]
MCPCSAVINEETSHRPVPGYITLLSREAGLNKIEQYAVVGVWTRGRVSSQLWYAFDPRMVTWFGWTQHGAPLVAPLAADKTFLYLVIVRSYL